MFFGQLHLALGRHHAEALDAADLADPDGGVDSGDVNAGLGDHDGDALARVGRAADDLLEAFVGVHLADTQAVGVRVLLGLDDLADGEITQLRAAILDAFNLEAQIGQGVGDVVDGGGRLKVIFEPGESEFHVLRAPYGFRASDSAWGRR